MDALFHKQKQCMKQHFYIYFKDKILIMTDLE